MIEDHTLACVLVGSWHGRWKGKTAIMGSSIAFKKFMTLLKGEKEFMLTIEESMGWVS